MNPPNSSNAESTTSASGSGAAAMLASRRRLLTGGASSAALLSVISTPVLGETCVPASRLASMHTSAATRADNNGVCSSTPASTITQPVLLATSSFITDEYTAKKQKAKASKTACADQTETKKSNSPSSNANPKAFKTSVTDACKADKDDDEDRDDEDSDEKAEAFKKNAESALAKLGNRQNGALAALKAVDSKIARFLESYQDQHWANGLFPTTLFSQAIGPMQGVGEASLLEVMLGAATGPHKDLAALLATALVNLRSGKASIPDIVLNETKIRIIASEFASKGYFEPTAGIRWDLAMTTAWLTQPVSISGMPMRGVGLRLQA